MKIARRLAAAVAAGTAGTLAMDLHLYDRYRREGGADSVLHWEFASDVTNWEQASAPGQVARKAIRAAWHQQPPDVLARPMTNLAHWATGVGWAVQYGLIVRKLPGGLKVGLLAFGPIVWLSSYVILGGLRVYKPIWEYDAETLAKDLVAHLIYGSTVVVSFAILTGGKPRISDGQRQLETPG